MRKDKFIFPLREFSTTITMMDNMFTEYGTEEREVHTSTESMQRFLEAVPKQFGEEFENNLKILINVDKMTRETFMVKYPMHKLRRLFVYMYREIKKAEDSRKKIILLKIRLSKEQQKIMKDFITTVSYFLDTFHDLCFRIRDKSLESYNSFVEDLDEAGIDRTRASIMPFHHVGASADIDDIMVMTSKEINRMFNHILGILEKDKV